MVPAQTKRFWLIPDGGSVSAGLALSRLGKAPISRQSIRRKTRSGY